MEKVYVSVKEQGKEREKLFIACELKGVKKEESPSYIQTRAVAKKNVSIHH